MRQVVLDTETTGMPVEEGHRIVEIGCVELLHRRITGNNLHLYIHPDRAIDAGAAEVHGITLEQLEDKPRFHEIADEFLTFLGDADLIIHNAPFDLGFLDAELARANADTPKLADGHAIIDTLVDARKRFPGQRNSLDALCKRFEIDNTSRTLHGALLDSELLADVYLAMTGGQIDMGLSAAGQAQGGMSATLTPAEVMRKAGRRPPVQAPDEREIAAHEHYLDILSKKSEDNCLWASMRQSSD